jgi:outer membrane protein OmpA-like peptidoglycan-associated protein
MRDFQLLVCTTAIALSASVTDAQTSVTYKDSRGRAVSFPLGDASFADEVVSFTMGTPPVRDKRWADPDLALRVPAYISEAADRKTATSLSMGCGGVLVLRFTDNALVNVDGPDLYVFEVGPAIEPTHLAISTDGEHWAEVGDIEGGTAAVDIAPVAKADQSYRYIRLTDLKSDCGGEFSGADIDAVGAIGSRLQLSFDASVLFDVDQSALKPAAQAALIEAALKLAKFEGMALTVEGHTDNTGTVAHNQTLSQARAESVRAFLASHPQLQGRAITSAGFGATRPVASNDTPAGRQKNRRVEIIVDPKR